MTEQIKQLLQETKNRGKLDFKEILKQVKPHLGVDHNLDSIIVYNGVGIIKGALTRVWVDVETYKDTEDCLISLETGEKKELTEFKKEFAKWVSKKITEADFRYNYTCRHIVDKDENANVNNLSTVEIARLYIFDYGVNNAIGNHLTQFHLDTLQKTIYKDTLVLDFDSFLISHPEPYLALTIINNHQFILTVLPQF